jgi:hypothetical protein
MAASGQITSGYWAALLIGVLLLVTFVAIASAGIMHVFRACRNKTARRPTDGLSDLAPLDVGPSLWRCQALSAEAITVRQLLSAGIDAEAYQLRTSELAWQAVCESRPGHNA